MASLNTLRTKFGALLSVIIALALLAFILSLKTDMGFSDNDPKVGVIDGDKIRYSRVSESVRRHQEPQRRRRGFDRSRVRPAGRRDVAGAFRRPRARPRLRADGDRGTRAGASGHGQRQDPFAGLLFGFRRSAYGGLQRCRRVAVPGRRPPPTPARNRRGTT